MDLRFLLLVMVLAASLGAPGASGSEGLTHQGGEATPAIPAQGPQARLDMPVRQAAQRFVAALSAQEEARLALVSERFAPSMFEDASAEAWIALLGAIAAASGGVDIVGDAPTEDSTFAEYILRARIAPRFARLVLGVAGEAPHRINTLFLLPARDPAIVRAEAWPQTRVPQAQIAAEIGRRVDSLLRQDALSGAVLVARNGDIVIERYAGAADVETGARIDHNTRFNLASAGKMFTAIAIARLAQQGRLSLQDRVDRWLPDYPEVRGRSITIAQLLSHTAGLGDFFGPAYRQNPSAFQSSQSYLPLIVAAPLFEPGARFRYSNAGYALLGIIVERASGEDYFSYVDRVVFRPARMRDAGFPTLAERDPHRAVGYFRPAEDAFGLGPRQANPDAIAFRGNAAGGAYATARDMLAFSRALTANRFLSPETTSLLLESRNDLVGGPRPSRYGYGFEETICAGRRFIGHNGGGPQSGVDSTMRASADGEWTIIVLSNYDVSEDLAEGICQFVARQ
jgi:D-alanyl-D-alanine carboxypeptidase